MQGSASACFKFEPFTRTCGRRKARTRGVLRNISFVTKIRQSPSRICRSLQVVSSGGRHKVANCQCRNEIFSNVFVASRRLRRELSADDAQETFTVWIEDTGS